MHTETDRMASITERVRTFELGGTILAVGFLGETAAAVLGDEDVILLSQQGLEQRVRAHEGGILCASVGADRLLTGGDDGRVVATDASGACDALAVDEKGRWIDQIAAGPAGAVGWAAGKAAFARTAAGEVRTLDLPSSAGGIAFAPKGFRLAVAHYNGVTLWFPNTKAAPERLDWKGSHLSVLFSPDGKFLITSMQEPMLHGWRLADGKHMRMSGYSGRVTSLSWSANGDWLATSGSEQLILWPFAGKDGPMGKTPRMLAPRESRVSCVACHPRAEVVGVGYADGMVLLVRLSDGAEILARKPSGPSVSALAWSRAGDRLAFGTEAGEAGLAQL